MATAAGVGPGPARLACFAAIALARLASGGTTGGVSALALLPVTWLGVYATSFQLGLGLATMAATFVFPLAVIGAPTYGPEEWRRSVARLVVGTGVGVAVRRLVAESRARALDIEQHVRTLTAFADAVRIIGLASDARADICEATSRLADANFAVLMEPAGAAHLEMTAMCGVEKPYGRVTIGGEASGAGRRLQLGRALLGARRRGDPGRLARRLLRGHGRGVHALRARLPRRGRRRRAGDRLATARRLAAGARHDRHRLLAGEVGAVRERAGLLARDRARRPRWPPADRGPARPRAFQRFNATRGHQAGNRLLKEAAAA